MTAPLKQRIDADMKEAMRAKQKVRLTAIRMLLAAVKQQEIDNSIILDDNQIIVLIDKLIKQRKDSIGHYEAAGRDDLVAQESAEIEVLQKYLPQPLSAEELNAIIEQVIQTTQASSVKDLGKVMTEIKPQVQGRADMRAVSQQIKQRLS